MSNKVFKVKFLSRELRKMSNVINNLNNKYNKLIEDLFEEVLCDKCRKTVKLGNIEGKLINAFHKETLLLCKECHNEITKQIKQI